MRMLQPIIAVMFLATTVLLCPSCGSVSNDTAMEVRDVEGNVISIREMERDISEVLKRASVAGLSCTIINDMEVAYSRTFGFKNAEAGTLADTETVFAAASWSKSVFAYLVIALAEDGHLDLDTPLVEYLSSPISAYPRFADLADDERHEEITARMVLSHTTGLPNSRIFQPGSKLGIMFDPGERFSYSAEAFELLQLVVEEVMGRGIQDCSEEMVFKPFGMQRTSFEWKDEFEADHALPHNRWMKPHFFRHRAASAAGSMVTTSADFARFIIGVLNEKARGDRLVRQMFETQVEIDSESMFGPGAFRESEESTRMHLAWGLGWGLFDSAHGRAFFRTGHGDGVQNYTVVFPDTGAGIVLLSNSDNFEGVAEEIIRLALGDGSSPYEWLGYVPFDPAASSPAPEARRPVTVEEKVLAEYAGTYVMVDHDTTHFKVQGSDLFYSSDGRYWEKMFAENPERFFFPNFPYIYEFVRDESGKVVSMDIVIEKWGVRIPSRKIE